MKKTVLLALALFVLFCSDLTSNDKDIIWSLPGHNTIHISKISNDHKFIATYDFDQFDQYNFTSKIIRAWDVSKRDCYVTDIDDSISSIKGIAFSPDSRTLYAALIMQNNKFRIRSWDMSTGKRKDDRVITDYAWLSVALSADGRYAAYMKLTAKADRDSVYVLDLENGSLVTTLDPDLGFKGGLIALSPDGSLIAGGTKDSTFIYDVQTGKRVRGIKNVYGLAPEMFRFSPDNKFLIMKDYEIQTYDISQGKIVTSFPSLEVKDLFFSKDSKYYIIIDESGITARLLGNDSLVQYIKVLNMESGDYYDEGNVHYVLVAGKEMALYTVLTDKPEITPLTEQTGRVLHFSVDNQSLFSYINDKFFIFKASDGSISRIDQMDNSTYLQYVPGLDQYYKLINQRAIDVYDIWADTLMETQDFDFNIMTPVFSPGKKFLIYDAYSKVPESNYLYNWSDRAVIDSLSFKAGEYFIPLFSPKGNYWAFTYAYKTKKLVVKDTRDFRAIIDQETASLARAFFSNDEKFLYVLESDTTMCLKKVDLANAMIVDSFPGIKHDSLYSYSLTQDDRYLIYYTYGKNDINVYDLVNKTNVYTYTYDFPVAAFELSPDNKSIIAYYKDKRYILWKTSFLPSSAEDNITTNDNAVLRIYPNPASERINIRIYRDELPGNISIFDSMGNEAKRFKASEIQGFNNSLTVNTEGLPQGLYFVKIAGKSGSISMPFIISR